jgi:uncharacterized protein (DUF1501 family)
MTTTGSHGCAEARALSRRALFRFAGALGVATATTASQARLAFGAPGDGDVLVVLALRGGFDGLAAVAPVGDPEYGRLRPTIGTPADTTKRVDDRFGLHPAMAPLFGLWDAGRLAAVHAAGQPASGRSHLVATADLERGTGAGVTSTRTGWVDRMLGVAGSVGLFGGSQVGSPTLPAAFAGPHDKVAMERIRDMRLTLGEDVAPLAAWQRGMAALHAGAPPAVSRPTSLGLRAVGGLRPLSGQPDDARSAGYPGGRLGEALHDVARLVRARVGVRVAAVDVDGWDLHAGAGRAGGGPMHDRLRELSEALAAFAGELGDDLGRVTLVTLSEFGRRAAENGSGGTDHGHGTAVLVLGGAVRGGRVHGRWPGLRESDLVDGDLAVTTDVRSILAEILTARLAVSAVSTVFPDFRPSPLGLVSPR